MAAAEALARADLTIVLAGFDVESMSLACTDEVSASTSFWTPTPIDPGRRH